VQKGVNINVVNVGKYATAVGNVKLKIGQTIKTIAGQLINQKKLKIETPH
jgi:hypothetical protein